MMTTPPKPDQVVVQMIEDLIGSSEDCWFDHHGGCQEHGYLSLEPGEMCPYAEAKKYLADWSE